MSIDDLFGDPNRVVVLDGGMGQELIHRGACEANPIWSAKALIDNPDMVGDLHSDFIAAGADVIITNTYSTTPHRFAEYVEGDRLSEIVGRAVHQAQRARLGANREVLIAGSLPPTRGSYMADRVAPYDVLVPEYRTLVDLLAPHVDLFICETMTTLEEARAAFDSASPTGKPVWVGWTLENHGPETLIDGTPFTDAVAAIDADAYLINCTSPEMVEAALPRLIAATNKPVGAYSNAFVRIPDGWSLQSGDHLPEVRDDLGPEAFSAHVRRCVDLGARIVGGCCEIGPAEIARMTRDLRLAAGSAVD
ncbi:MAG: homocysteine S-methyltransferase family protein [Acidimicrobiales bacterium]